MISIYGNIWIRKIDRKLFFVAAYIVERLGQRITVHQICALVLLITPGKESIDYRFAFFTTQLEFLLRVQLLFSGLFFQLVQGTNTVQCLIGGFRFNIFRFDKISARMRPALCLGDLGLVFGVAISLEWLPNC